MNTTTKLCELRAAIAHAASVRDDVRASVERRTAVGIFVLHARNRLSLNMRYADERAHV